jgi:hypothetical protein
MGDNVVSQKRNKESVKRAGILRKMCFHWIRDNKPELLLRFRRRIDNVVRPRRRYSARPGNKVGL